MKRKTILALTVAGAAAVAASFLALPAVAHGPGGGQADGGGAGYGAGYGAGKGMHGRMGMMGRMGMASGGFGPGARMLERLDTDRDGTVTPEEARAAMQEQIKTHDSDGDGVLSLDEFAALHAAQARTRMADRFQFLDEDGDGKVTEAEMNAPFMMMVNWMGHSADGKAGPGVKPRGGRGMGPGAGRGGMQNRL